MKLVFANSTELEVNEFNENYTEKDTEEKKSATVTIDAKESDNILAIRNVFAADGALATMRIVTEEGEVVKENLKLVSVSEFINDERHTFSIRLSYKA